MINKSLIKKYTLPLTGNEKTFQDHSAPFNHHVQGSNCYSYAMDHFETNADRPNKTVPGDVFKMRTKRSHKFTDWQSCSNAIKRVLDDGVVVQKYYKLKKKLIMKGSEKQKCKPNYRKICMVVETNAEPKGVPTDFHFYAQNKILPTDLFNMPKSMYPEKKHNNIYIDIGINAFSSSLQIRRFADHNIQKRRLIKVLLEVRALFNIQLHIDYIPEYMIEFMIDPWWILDIPPGRRTKANLTKRKDLLLKYCIKKKPLHSKVINIAYKQCMEILKKKRKPIDKLKAFGIWSHKLGHATKGLNTDGNGKIIFHPGKASRNHGSNYDYDKVCQYFQVLSGWGTSDLVDKNRKMNNTI